MKVKLACTIILLLVLISIPAQAVEPFVLYDNFSTTFLDPDRWIGQELTNQGLVNLECAREIDRGALHFRSRIYGTPNTYDWANGGPRLFFTAPDEVTAMKAIVQVNAVEANGCDYAGGKPSRASLRLSGFFFNTGTERPSSNTAENDILAYIALQRQSDYTDKSSVLHVAAYVAHCNNPSCGDNTPIFSYDLGTIKLYKPAEISIQWDKEYHQFIFGLDRRAPVYFDYSDYLAQNDWGDTALPGIRMNKRVEMNNFLPKCTSGALPVAYLDALVDNVSVNEGAAP